MYQRSIELITFEARLPLKELAHHDQHPDDHILLYIFCRILTWYASKFSRFWSLRAVDALLYQFFCFFFGSKNMAETLLFMNSSVVLSRWRPCSP